MVSIGQAASTNLGTLDLNGRSQQIAGLDSTSGTNVSALVNNTVTSTAAATLTIGGSGTYSYGAGTDANSGVITGAISLFKQGSGTQTLGDANTYTGTTTVNGGTLLVNGSTVSSSAVTVGSSGTLGGTGNAAGTVAVNGTLSAGNSTAVDTTGTLTTGALTLNSGSFSLFQIEGTTAGLFDRVNVTGALAYNGILQIDFTNSYTPTLNQTFDLFDFSGQSGNFSSISFLDSGFDGSFDTSNGLLTITAVPEPSTYLGGALILGLAAWSQRKRFGKRVVA